MKLPISCVKTYYVICYVLGCMIGMSLVNTRSFTRLAFAETTKTQTTAQQNDEIKLEPADAAIAKQLILKSSIVNGVTGRLVYTVRKLYPDVDKLPTYMVIRLNKAKPVGDASQENSNLTEVYQVKKMGSEKIDGRAIFNPQFSPDGRYILFKYGEPTSSHGLYQLYVFDTVSKKLTLVSKKEPSYRITSWSPDGQYIAFVTGGDFQGNVFELDSYVGPLKLYVCNWRTGEENLVAQSDSVRGPFSWSAPHSLIYGILSDEGQKLLYKRQEEASQEEEPLRSTEEPKYDHGVIKGLKEPQPNIFIYSLEDKRSRLLFQDGYRPQLSSDANWVAFFGSEHPDKPYPLRPGWQNAPDGAVLSVSKLDGSDRVALNRQGGSYPYIYWRNDNQHILSLEQTKYSPDAQVQLKEWDIKTKKFRVISTLNAKDYRLLPRPEVEPQFRPLYLNNQRTTLFLSVQEVTGPDKDISYMLIAKYTIYAINMMTGDAANVAQVEDVTGLDWYSGNGR